MTDQHQPIAVGRYLLHRKIARGGMATIHIARLLGDVGFSRIVAAKRMHPELADDDEFVAMFLDEARIASKVHHRNVVNVLDVVTLGTEVMLVQEYVHGVPLSVLLRNAYEASAHVPVPVAAAIACHVLAGLHAAHETTDELGTPLQIVHRDVSPQNIMIGVDGTARLLDFGVAKAAMSAHVTRKGTFKGKISYSPPEQIRGEATRQSDIYSLGVVLWELIVGHRLHNTAQSEPQLIAEIMAGKLPTITEALADQRSWIGAYRWSQLEAIEPVIRKALDTNPRRRWTTAAEMEEAIAAAVPIAPASDIAAWLRAIGQKFLDDRERMIAEEEASWRRNGGALALLAQTSEAVIDGAPTNPLGDGGAVLLAPTTTASDLARVAAIRPWYRRIAPTTALLATLVVLFGGAIAFLVRDLDATQTIEHIGADNEPRAPGTLVPPRPITPELSRVDEPADAPALTSTLPPEQPIEAPAAALPPPKPAPRPRPTVRHVVRPSAPPARPITPPAKHASSTLDCTTPFYFEGRKKLFKAGCL